METGPLRLVLCFALQVGIQTSVLTVAPLKTFALLGDLRLVSAAFSITGSMILLGRLLVPTLVRRFSHHKVLFAAIALAISAASLLATDELVLYLPALSLFGVALASIEIILTLFVLADIPRSRVTYFERLRITLSAIPWTIGPWLGIYLKVHIGEKAPFELSALLGLILLLCVTGSGFGGGRLRVDANANEQSIVKFTLRYFMQPRLRLAWLLAFGRSAWWTTFYAYAPILVVVSGLGENLSGLVVSAGTATIWAVPLWAWIANRIYLRRLLIAGYFFTALFTLAASAVAGSRALFAVTLLVLAAGIASSIDAAGNTLFLRAVRVKDRLEMAPVFATFRDVAQCAPPALFAVLLIFLPLQAVFAATGCIMLGMADLARRVPKTF